MKFYTSARTAMASLGIEILPAMEKVELTYPTYVNEYYLSLINPSRWRDDPIAYQCLPNPQELMDISSSSDPLAEQVQSPVPHLIHRYEDRVVLLATGRCAMRCRFCFRKRAWTCGTELEDLSEEQLQEVAQYLRATPAIREVLVSGGDPLMLPFEHFKEIVDTLSAIPSIQVIRIGSRIPVVWPERIDDKLARYLGAIPGLWLATHFNHPREVTPEAIGACERLIRTGVPLLNQTVLLKGVNADPEVLEDLFRRLIAIRVKPHYLFHVDPVRGVRHFATGIEKGLEMLRYFRPRLSSIAVPTFAIDLPEGGGKVALQPDYGQAGGYLDIHGKKLIKYESEL